MSDNCEVTMTFFVTNPAKGWVSNLNTYRVQTEMPP